MKWPVARKLKCDMISRTFRKKKFIEAIICLSAMQIAAPVSMAGEAEDADETHVRSVPVAVPDIREDETKLKVQKGDFVVVPIPISNPTFDTGLVLGAAYFYPQTEDQKKVQPASVTAAAGVYTSNESFAYGIAQQNYWNDNNWRFSGVAGHVDLKLGLNTPDAAGDGATINWLVKGDFLHASISRRIAGKWYAGVFGRLITMNQSFGDDVPADDTVTEPDAKSVGIGISTEYDSRDQPFNSHTGVIFEIDALFNGEAIGGSDNYQSYSSNFRSYHQLPKSIVLAWEAQACTRSGPAPLWDACRVDLRGFSATDYLGRSSASAQAEVRWQFHPKWGVVAFAGGGYVTNSFSELRDRELIPSYGLGLRFMVLKSQGINVRVDYARSVDSDAVYLSVGEAF